MIFKRSCRAGREAYGALFAVLPGSQAVAQEYAAKGKKVRAMLQMDMTALFVEIFSLEFALHAEY